MKIKFFFSFLFFVIYSGNSHCITFNSENSFRSPGNPIEFIENKGQIVDAHGVVRTDICFSGKGSRANIYIRKGGISYVLSGVDTVKELGKVKLGIQSTSLNSEKLNQVQSNLPISLQRVDVEFFGSNDDVKIKADDTLEEKFNYYLGHCPQGILGVRAYKKITYEGVYPGIDISFYGNNLGGFEYDFIINPGADPNNIQLKYSGAEGLSVSSEGKLVIRTQLGEIVEWIPSTYQVVNGKRIKLTAKYVLEGTVVKFHVDHYDKSKQLIIDPWSTWITYLGGTIDDDGHGITVDLNGNILNTGFTYSSNFPVFVGFQMSFAGSADVYVAKFNSAGKRLWITYYGGGDGDVGISVATDCSNNVYITGYTGPSTTNNFPVFSGFQMSARGSLDAFVVKFNSSGIRTWATFLGGSDYDEGYGIALDGSGNLFITGYTKSTNFPVLLGFQMSLAGNRDAFIAKFNSSGNRLWITYFGGISGEEGNGIAIDKADNVLITGRTGSTNLPVFAGFQMSTGGLYDGFVAKFDNSGNRLWSTYYGGSESDNSRGIATDGSNNVFITGSTISLSVNNFPTFAGFQMGYGGGSIWGDAFIVKFDDTGNRLWATYYGGNADEYGASLATDGSGNCYATGSVNSFNFPVTGGSCQSTRGGFAAGIGDHYLVSFDPFGNRLCATYVGGSGSEFMDLGSHITISGCYAYITGFSSGNYSVTTGSQQTTYGGGLRDAIVAQLPKDCSCSLPLSVSSLSTPTCSSQCSGTATAIPCGQLPFTYLWSNGRTTQTITGLCGGTYTVTVSDATTATITDTINITTVSLPVATILADSTICAGKNATLSSPGGIAYLWSNGATTSSIVVNPSITTTYSLSVTYASSCFNSCSNNAIGSKTIIINSLPVPVISGNFSICTGESTSLVASGGTNYLWSTGASTSVIIVNPIIQASYSVTLTDGNGCKGDGSVIVAVKAVPLANAGFDVSICTGSGTTLNATGNGTYYWSPTTSLSCLTCSNPVATPSATTSYSLSISNSCGSITDSVKVVVTQTPSVNAGADATVCSGTTISLVASGSGIYSWAPITGLSCSTCSNPTANPTSSTNYIVTVAGICGSGSDTVSIEVDAPNASITGISPICIGDSVVLSAFGGGTYLWNTSATTSWIIVSPSSLTTYSVTATSTLGCYDTASLIITVSEPPVTILSSVTICSGDVATLSATGGGNYLWSNGSTNSAIQVSPMSAMTYSVVVFSGACSDTASAVVTVVSNPVVSAASNVTITQGESTTLTASGGGIYAWSNGLTDSSIIVSPTISTFYCITVTNTNNCTDSDCVTVSVIVEPVDCSNIGDLYLPNAFSPNGDNENDEFKIFYGNFSCIKSQSITIYNRWGEIVFESSEIEFKWSGIHNDKILDSGVYTYYLRAILVMGEEISRKGNVSLMK